MITKINVQGQLEKCILFEFTIDSGISQNKFV